MTSVLPEEESKVAKLKQKMMSTDIHVKEETRSFLSFSRENLSISHSDLEKGFNRHRFRPNRNTILSIAALLIASICLGLETWKLHCSLVNAREIEDLKREVQNLQHRFLKEDLLHELKAFEEQLYAEESNDDDDPGEADIDNADYDSNYEYDTLLSLDYSGDYQIPPTYGSRPSDFPESASPIEPVPTPPDPSSNKTLKDFLVALRKIEARRGQEFEKSVREGHKSMERERLLEQHKKKDHLEKLEKTKNATKPKRDLSSSSQYPVEWKRSHEDRAKQKRSIDEIDRDKVLGSQVRHTGRNHTRRTILSRFRSRKPGHERNLEANHTASFNVSDGHPPKKYHAHECSDPTHALPAAHRNDFTGKTARSDHQRLSEDTEKNNGQRFNWRDNRETAMILAEMRDSLQAHESSPRQLRRGMTRRHLRAPRQIYAIHYGADSTLFSEEDEHTGNGRARHNDGIFKAWRPSTWAVDLGMNRHFALASDGRLTVNEPGLYLAYAQIHYLDEHDENGFHLLVNDRPILQCMIYSPGIGHKSRSCFSAQVTLLDAGDVLILKEVGSARYTLFQHDKSFFGLAKLGETRQQQRHQTQPPPQQ